MEEVPRLAFREKLLLKTEYNFSKKKNRLALATARYNAATTPEEKQIEAKIKNPEKLRMTIEKFSNSLNS